MGWTVVDSRLDDSDNSRFITRRRTWRGRDHRDERWEWRLIQALGDLPVPVLQLPVSPFFASHAEFTAWAKGRKERRMEWFYREMRRTTGLLTTDGQPEGGK